MACLDMYNQNNDRKSLGLPMSPRISFSNDFVESGSSHSYEPMRMYRDEPVSTDFEFSVNNSSMMSADELFSQGRLLPLRENTRNKITTIRDELEVADEDKDFSLKPPKSSTRWKGFLGLKKSHIGSRKLDKNEGSSSHHRSASISEFVNAGKTSQEMMNDGGSGSGSKNVEFRM